MIKALLLVVLLAPTTALADKNFVGADDGDKWDCATDPIVNVLYGKGTFTFTGACTEININGSGVKVTATDAATLNLNGAKNVAAIDEIGAININGASNKVTWKKAKTGAKPTASTNGKGNSIAKLKK